MKKLLWSLAVLAAASCSSPPTETFDEPIREELFRPKHVCCCTKKLIGCVGNCGCPCESCYNAVKRGD